MTQLIDTSQAQSELTDWRVLVDKIHATFQTGSFIKGAQFIADITELAEAANHHPDIDLRYPSVHISLQSHDVGGLTSRDVNLAKQISELAAQSGIEIKPGAPLTVEIGIDAIDIPRVKPFWKAILDYTEHSDNDLIDPSGIEATVWFQQMDEPRPQRNRVHLDVHVPHDTAEARVAAAIRAGGHLVNDQYAPSFWVLADAEGNEACVCTWQAHQSDQ